MRDVVKEIRSVDEWGGFVAIISRDDLGHLIGLCLHYGLLAKCSVISLVISGTVISTPK